MSNRFGAFLLFFKNSNSFLKYHQVKGQLHQANRPLYQVNSNLHQVNNQKTHSNFTLSNSYRLID
ncbi:hypothetical protein SAMN04487893_10649 [Myroides guanonis]|uniref:Uncharacterized protein n=1 Tax=Myroides guanonis TaxID=1150112 RepID=A0A1I3QP94_9FLAO|nr:hypothetical protein SAMN04487893_10649 [Myroides guanonis]